MRARIVNCKECFLFIVSHHSLLSMLIMLVYKTMPKLLKKLLTLSILSASTVPDFYIDGTSIAYRQHYICLNIKYFYMLILI